MTVLELCFSSGIPAQLPPTPLPAHPEFLISGREEGTLSSQALSCPVLPQGRNASEQVKMLQRIEQYNAKQPLPQRVRVSVEIEKPREELFQLFGYGEVVSALQLLLSPLVDWVLKRTREDPSPAYQALSISLAAPSGSQLLGYGNWK